MIMQKSKKIYLISMMRIGTPDAPGIYDGFRIEDYPAMTFMPLVFK